MQNRLFFICFVSLMLSLAACQSVQPPPAEIEPEPTPAVESEPQAEVLPDPAQLLFESAMSLSKAGKPDQAIEQFGQLLKLESEYAKVYTNLGLLFLQKNRTEDAKAAFLTAIEQDKTDAIAYNHLAIIERQQGLFEQAKNNYLQALNAEPEYANAQLNLGILMDIYLQDLPSALSHYQKYQQLTNNNNKDVDKWIVDIQHRIEKKAKAKR